MKEIGLFEEIFGYINKKQPKYIYFIVEKAKDGYKAKIEVYGSILKKTTKYITRDLNYKVLYEEFFEKFEDYEKTKTYEIFNSLKDKILQKYAEWGWGFEEYDNPTGEYAFNKKIVIFPKSSPAKTKEFYFSWVSKFLQPPLLKMDTISLL